MNPSLLVAECLATPWALMPERLHALASVVTRWSVGNAADPDTLKQIEIDRVAREIRRASNAAPAPSGIAVLPLYGVITQRGNMVDAVSGPGMTSTQQFSAALRELVADKSVSQILIDIDSPGGSVYGVCELADEIMAARAQKPVVAIANSLAASAAYWIGCAASEFYVTPGGEVGSIGVWQAHQDFSRALDEAGVTTTLISAGKFKVEGRLAAKSDVIPVRGTKLAGLDAKDRPVMHNPFSTAARAYLKDMTMLAAELGFTPSSRARLGAAESTVSDVEDPWAQIAG